MEDLPDFAGEREPTSEALAPEAQPAPVAPQQDKAPAITPQAAPAPSEAAPAAIAPPVAPIEHAAPLSALLDEREKRQAAEKRANELQQWREQQEAQARRQPLPDPEQDPVGYQQAQAAQFQSALYTQTLTFSRRMAEMEHGPDVTKTAFEWGVARCDQDPFFNEKVRASQDPVGTVVAEWKREQLLSKLDPTDLEAFQAWKASQTGQAPALAPQAAAPAARPAAPRPSLAAAPSAGAHADPQPLGAERTFERMFGT